MTECLVAPPDRCGYLFQDLTRQCCSNPPHNREHDQENPDKECLGVVPAHTCLCFNNTLTLLITKLQSVIIEKILVT